MQVNADAINNSNYIVGTVCPGKEFSKLLSVVKLKPKQSLWPITKDTDNPVNQ